MSTADVVVVLIAAVVLAGLAWFFFGPRRAQMARRRRPARRPSARALLILDQYTERCADRAAAEGGTERVLAELTGTVRR